MEMEIKVYLADGTTKEYRGRCRYRIELSGVFVVINGPEATLFSPTAWQHVELRNLPGPALHVPHAPYPPAGHDHTAADPSGPPLAQPPPTAGPP